nr:alpha/beta hydrolase [uncultured Dongia sp.]
MSTALLFLATQSINNINNLHKRYPDTTIHPYGVLDFFRTPVNYAANQSLKVGTVPKVTLAALSDETLNQQFMPRIAVPDHEKWLSEDLDRSAKVRAKLGGRLNVPYGPGPRQVLDIFPAKKPGAPILVWIHGGYWRALSKDHYTTVVPPLLAAGAAVVLVGYDLCPTVTLAELLAQTRAALRWVRGHAAEMGGNPDRLILAGNSAGAHICAMALQYDWPDDSGTADSIRAAALITGIYDLTPVPRIAVQQEVRLTTDDVERLSPMKLPVRSTAICLVAVGGNEPDMWIGQSRDYHAKLLAAGVSSDLMIMPGRHHFSITRDLADATTPLTQAVIGLLDS